LASKYDGPRGRTIHGGLLDFKLTNWHGRAKDSTPVQPHSTQFTPRACGHGRTVVRHVVEPEGPAAYLCRPCWVRTCATEVRDAIRRQFNNLFNLCPRIFGSGGASRLVDYLLARALLAAYRDRGYQLWIALARVAARIAERGAA
jgi:hypothetical protein